MLHLVTQQLLSHGSLDLPDGALRHKGHYMDKVLVTSALDGFRILHLMGGRKHG